VLLLTVIWVGFPTAHAAPTLALTPASNVVDQGSSASYQLTLGGGNPNATYALTLTGLPPGSVYSFSPTTIGASGSSTLNIQSVLPNSLYCPGSYQFTVTATNPLVNSDSASVTGAFLVSQSSHQLLVSVSTDNSTYTIGENVAITITSNTAAEGTLSISTSAGPAISRKYQFSGPTNLIIPLRLNSTSPLGQWTVTFLADDYCGSTSRDSKTFNVIPMTTIITTITTTSVHSFTTSTLTTTTATSQSTHIFTQTGNLTVTYTTFSATATTQLSTVTISPPQITTSVTVTLWKIEHPFSEAMLAIVLLFSALILLRRVIPGRGSVCSKCGFSNPPSATSYCVSCGERLRKRRFS